MTGAVNDCSNKFLALMCLVNVTLLLATTGAEARLRNCIKRNKHFCSLLMVKYTKINKYSLWLVVYKARMDIVLPACCTFQVLLAGRARVILAR